MTSGNLAGNLDTLLSSLGVVRTDTRGRVEDTIQSELTRLGHRATVVELRYGVLTLEASQVDTQLLRYERDKLLAILEKELPGVVTDLKVRVRRR